MATDILESLARTRETLTQLRAQGAELIVESDRAHELALETIRTVGHIRARGIREQDERYGRA